MSERIAYLQLINADANNNRFYRMRQEGNVIIVEFGRNGATPVTQKKPVSLWDVIYNKKIAEGYVETADLHIVEKKEVQNEKYAPIKDSMVRKFFDDICHYANKELKTKYLVSWSDVTEEQINKAQELIKKIDNCTDLKKSKELLLELFAIIPRKMKYVADYLPSSLCEMGIILQREQELLDVLAAQVSQDIILKNKSKEITILEALGLEIRPVTTKEEEQILKFLSAESAPRYKRAYRIKNKKTDDRFYAYMKEHGMTDKNVSYLYHGSRNQNYYGLMTQGPLLNPNAPITGKMFGQGIYFANRAKKSINYTSLRGSYWAGGTSNQAFLAVYKVAYKNAMDVSCHTCEMTRYTAKKIAPYDAVFAHGGADLINDEIIIYNEAQCTLQYLIELQ